MATELKSHRCSVITHIFCFDFARIEVKLFCDTVIPYLKNLGGLERSFERSVMFENIYKKTDNNIF